MPRPPRTVLIPAAGLGTRLLPLTRTTPKELLPVYDLPVIQFAIDEAVALGAERIVVVIHPSKSAIRDYIAEGNPSGRATPGEVKSNLVTFQPPGRRPDHVEFIYAIQQDALGLGHAVACCAQMLLPGPIGVILPDDVILGAPCLSEMADYYPGGHMVAAMEVAPSQTAKYGIFIPSAATRRRCLPVAGMVEKPAAGLAPSTLAAVGRYILDPRIMATLAATRPGSGNEIQLTDAIVRDAPLVGLTAFRFSGSRHDCGSLDGLLEAGVARRSMVGGRSQTPRGLTDETRPSRIAAN